MLNKVQLIGRIGADVEMKQISEQLQAAKIRLATNTKKKNPQSGELEDVTTWHNIKAFGQTAENIGKICHKGDLMYIEGKLSTNTVEKNGEKRTYTDIIADKFFKLNSKDSNNPFTKSEGVNRGVYGTFHDLQDKEPYRKPVLDETNKAKRNDDMDDFDLPF